MHLLVIEDERALCETIVRSLRRLAYSVDYCYDGEKALELLGVERAGIIRSKQPTLPRGARIEEVGWWL